MLEHLVTEQRNPASMDLDELPVGEILRLMNREDEQVVRAVARALPAVEQVVERCVRGMKAGGRIIYVGAGTSGRIGLLDAVECPPTFGMSPDRVVGVLAGGENQIFAKEEAEDSPALGRQAMERLALTPEDVVIGLAASGRTPFVVGALAEAARAGASTACVVCNPGTEIARQVELPVEIDNGPEVLTGSTRLKAGTSQKMVCNMISTATMVRLGKVYQNLMIDVDVSNEKLYHRWLSMVQTAAGCTPQQAAALYEPSHHNAKAALCMFRRQMSYEEALRALEEAEGVVGRVLREE